MLFLKALIVGFAFTLGLEISLGLCIAIGSTVKGARKNEKH